MLWLEVCEIAAADVCVVDVMDLPSCVNAFLTKSAADAGFENKAGGALARWMVGRWLWT